MSATFTKATKIDDNNRTAIKAKRITPAKRTTLNFKVLKRRKIRGT